MKMNIAGTFFFLVTLYGIIVAAVVGNWVLVVLLVFFIFASDFGPHHPREP